MLSVGSVLGPYKVDSRIGQGSASVVFQVINITNGKAYAMKICSLTNQEKHWRLLKEYTICKRIQEKTFSNSPVPKVYWYNENGQYSYLVMDLLGMSIDSFFSSSFYPKTNNNNWQSFCKIALDILSTIQNFHSAGFIHADISPKNIMLTRKTNNEPSRAVLIDFTLSFHHKHPPNYKTSAFRGNLAFGSINAHLCSPLQFKDDIESFVYMLLYLWNKGFLPWNNIVNNTTLSIDSKVTQIYNIKKIKNLETLFPRSNENQALLQCLSSINTSVNIYEYIKQILVS